ncbi:MAG: rhodanese-like domain-containing protein [Lachnospiraceae bacterium]|nr:rhodanese-like domain-containing protein [Lachnospiraceae bacterium]
MVDTILAKDVLSIAVEQNALVIDVRDYESFRKGHIPMAIWMDLEEIKRGNIKIRKNRPLIVYCERGSTSMLAVKELNKLGYHAMSVIGGLRQYKGPIARNNKF